MLISVLLVIGLFFSLNLKARCSKVFHYPGDLFFNPSCVINAAVTYNHTLESDFSLVPHAFHSYDGDLRKFLLMAKYNKTAA